MFGKSFTNEDNWIKQMQGSAAMAKQALKPATKHQNSLYIKQLHTEVDDDIKSNSTNLTEILWLNFWEMQRVNITAIY